MKKQTVTDGYQYDDNGNILLYKKGKHKGEPKLAYVYKDLTFLQKPLCYKKPQLALPVNGNTTDSKSVTACSNRAEPVSHKIMRLAISHALTTVVSTVGA